jgi:hypothetical protein
MTESKDAKAPDTITRYAVFNTTLQQFVGGVATGDKPSDSDAKALLEQYGMKGHKHEVRTV